VFCEKSTRQPTEVEILNGDQRKIGNQPVGELMGMVATKVPNPVVLTS